MEPPTYFSGLIILAFFSFSCNNALALQVPPPPAKPVLIGTSDYSNVLFGKLQRAAALYGTNLGEPTTILGTGDKEGKLDKCLWSQFAMANPGSDGILSRKDLVDPLSYYNDLRDMLVFFDAATPKEEKKGGGFYLPFMKKSKQQEEDTMIPTIDVDILQCAVERGCAHIYVLSNPESFEGCRKSLEATCSGKVGSTILCLEQGISMTMTDGWTTSRPQDMEGEFSGAIALRGYNDNNNNNVDDDGPSLFGTATIPVEDVAEVMMHVALRTDREFNTHPRSFQLAPSSSDDDELVERLNKDYFTMMGGENARKMAGTVQSVASWGSFLSPMGEVNTELGRRPDRQL